MQEAAAAAAQGLPLPATQWERQSAIFNQYPHFSLSLSSSSSHSLDQINQTSSDAKNKDLEPGRCKRTDGKKWRCSKPAVAPNYKYCDPHLNRGRARRRRSRKLVETPQPSDHHHNHNSHCSDLSPLISTLTTADYPLLLLPPDHHGSDDAYFPSFSSQEPNSGNEVVAFEDEWNQLLLKDMGFMTAGFDASVFRQDFSAVGSSLIETNYQSAVSSFDSSFSSLTLSMAMAAAANGGCILDDEMGSIKSGLDMEQVMQRDLILTNTDDGEISRQDFSGFQPTENLQVQNKRRRVVCSDGDQLLNQSMAAGYILDMNVEEEEDYKGLKSIWSSVPPDGGPLGEALRPCLGFWGSDHPVE